MCVSKACAHYGKLKQLDFLRALSYPKAIELGEVRPTLGPSLCLFEELYIKVVQQEEGKRHQDDRGKNVSNYAALSENKLFAEWTAMC